MAQGIRSPQMKNLMVRYGATTQPALLRAIRNEYTEETGERHTIRDAELMLDGMLEAEYQRIAGGAYGLPAELAAGRMLVADPDVDYDENTGWAEEAAHPSWA